MYQVLFTCIAYRFETENLETKKPISKILILGHNSISRLWKVISFWNWTSEVSLCYALPIAKKFATLKKGSELHKIIKNY